MYSTNIVSGLSVLGSWIFAECHEVSIVILREQHVLEHLTPGAVKPSFCPLLSQNLQSMGSILCSLQVMSRGRS